MTCQSILAQPRKFRLTRDPNRHALTRLGESDYPLNLP